MAAPNIVDVTTILGESGAVALSSTSPTVIVNNAAGSNKVLKVNLLLVANVDGSDNADVTLALHPEDDGGGTGVQIAGAITVPAKATLDVLSRPIYLKEDQSIVATASAADDLAVTFSYEEIDDA